MVFSKGKTLGKGVQNRKFFAPAAGQKIANTSWDYGLDLEPQKPPLVKSDFDYKGGGFITSIRTDIHIICHGSSIFNLPQYM